MKSFQSLALSGAAAATVLFTAVPADATIITQTITFGASGTDFQAQQAFNLFNTNLGTLNYVNVSATSSMTTGGTVTNNGASSATSILSLITNFNFSGGKATFDYNTLTNGSSSNGALDAFVQSFIATSTTSRSKSFTLGAGASATLTSATTGGSSISTGNVTTGAELALFSAAGGGTDYFSMYTLSTQAFSGGGNNFSQNVTETASATLTIQYDYTAAPPPAPPPPPGVPEPASMALLGAGLLGLGASVRRKRRT